MVDIPGDSSTTAVATIGSVSTSAIDALGDHDWYRVSLAAGQTITITATGGGALDTYLNVYDPAGTTILASNDDIVTGTNTNSRLTFTASGAGTYFIDVGSFNNQNTGTYDLYVEPTPQPVFNYDQIAFQLTSGFWGGDVHHWAVTQGGTLTVNISTLTAAEQTLARAALQEWSDIIGVHFQEVSAGGQINFSDAEDTAAKGPVAQTDANWSSSGIITSANVQISQSWVSNYGASLASYSFQTYIHEIGHALGLGHGGEYNDTATYATDALYANDSWSTTIMSYFDQQQNSYFAGQGFTRLYALTPMAADVAAMQSLYGLSTTTRAGNTTYGDNSNAGGVYDAVAYPRAAFTIFDSGGNDTIDYSRVGVAQLINLNPGTFSNVNGLVGNLSIAPGTIIENAIGGSGADKIIGNSADNVLTGGLGADTLTGGGGNDIFQDTETGHNGDTITDFHVGDQIIFTDAALGSFSYSLSGNTLTYTGGSMTLLGSVKGTLNAIGSPIGGVELTFASASTPLSQHAHNDFNGDGRSDILWLNDNGTVTDWLGSPDGSFSGNWNNLHTTLPTGFAVVGIGDYNGDHIDDLLLRNSSGTITEWLGHSNGSFTTNSQFGNADPGSSWHVVGTGDFNGDGLSDILWRNDDGTLTDWLGNASGTFSGNWNNLHTALPTGFTVVATGDYNGDHFDDLLLRNSVGGLTEWLGQANGSFIANSLFANTDPGSSWHVVGTGDFNGDGLSDILWRNNDGTLTDWLGSASGTFSGNWNNLHTALPAGYTVAAIGDYNGDGVDDLLLRNSSGGITEWLGQSNGSFAANTHFANPDPGTSWHVQDPFVHDPFG